MLNIYGLGVFSMSGSLQTTDIKNAKLGHFAGVRMGVRNCLCHLHSRVST